MFRLRKEVCRRAVAHGSGERRRRCKATGMQRHYRLSYLAGKGMAEFRRHAFGDVYNRLSTYQLGLRQRIGPHRCEQRSDDQQLRNGSTTDQYSQYSLSAAHVKQALPL